VTRLLAYVPEAFESIWRNRTRSFLSMLGMVIGIASVIGVLGLSQAGANGMKAMISSGGDPGYIVMPDRSQNDPSIATMSYHDVALLQSYVPEIKDAIPLYVGHEYRVTGSGKSDFVEIDGYRAMSASEGFRVVSGRLLDREDVVSAANVCVISQSIADKLFPNQDALGRTIDIGTQRMTIVGVYTVSGSLFNSVSGDTGYIPYTTAHHINPGPVDFIWFWLQPGTPGVQAIADVKAAMSRIHPRAQYLVQDRGASLGIFESVLSSIGVGLTFIGGIALFVAGVGIMNIMLVSVTERTREIGIRKSIGASSSDIGMQFLIEATILSLVGGGIGTALGIGIVLFGRGIIEKSIGAAPVPWVLVIGIAVGFSTIVGIAFGSLPAARAGKLDPVEALRS
jgi:putative ABC transport system permease protein